MDKPETRFSVEPGPRLCIQHEGRELAANVQCTPAARILHHLEKAGFSPERADDTNDALFLSALQETDTEVSIENLEDGITGKRVKLTASIREAFKQAYITEIEAEIKEIANTIELK